MEPQGRYDLVYKSRVFTDTYSKDTIVVNNAEKVIQGGTGYGPAEKTSPMRSSTSGRTTFCIRGFWERLTAF